MLGLVSRLNRMSTGQVVAIWLVVAVILGIAAVVFIQSRGDEEAGAEAALEEGQQLVQVRRGDLVNQITSSGSVVFPNRQELTFGTTGTIGEILVAEGDNVALGQELARYDDATVTNLQRDVAQAEFDLQRSKDTLEELSEPPSELDIVEAEAAIAKAELAVQNAEEALVEVEDPVTQEEIDDALADVTSAEESLAEAQDNLQDVIDDHADRVQAAVESLDTAKEGYQGAVTNFLGQTLTAGEYLLTPEEFFASYDIDLVTFFSDDQLEDAVTSVLPLAPGPLSELDDPETPWDEFTVYRWIALYPGAVYGNCENINTAPRDVCVLQEMERAWDPVDKAQSTLETAESNAETAASNAEDAIEREEDALKKAEEALEEVYVTSDDLEVQVKVHDVAVAKARLDDANAKLEELHETADETTVALREAQIEANEATLIAALARLDEVVITAPFAGEVSAVFAEAGNTVNANNFGSAVLEIVDTSVAEVDARLDEIDVLNVQVGAEVIVELDGLPGAGLPGVVREISTTGENQQGVVTYPIQITMRTPPLLQLREGLSATATIVLQQELDVLLIPASSIAGTIAQPTVLVDVGGEVAERAVTLGTSDGFWVVVTDGINEGESIVSTGGGADAPNFATIRTPQLGGLGGLGGAGLGQGGAGNLTPEQRRAIRDQIRAQGGAGAGAGGQRGQGAGQ
ncbi:MAG: HlyD family efflux transporter periplasmic adaptor subunit [Chloroflexi bacterium]|nr:HlyD family efflux transporter periplasmic adaptor subunit [Chloroflexota bacterium]